jgi:hypothetical protein
VVLAELPDPDRAFVGGATPWCSTPCSSACARAAWAVDSALAGNKDIHLCFLDSGGSPLAVDAAQVSATTAEPARRLPVTPVTADHVAVAGASLPSPGTWTIAVTAVRAGTPLDFTFEVPIT